MHNEKGLLIGVNLDIPVKLESFEPNRNHNQVSFCKLGKGKNHRIKGTEINNKEAIE